MNDVLSQKELDGLLSAICSDDSIDEHESNYDRVLSQEQIDVLVKRLLQELKLSVKTERCVGMNTVNVRWFDGYLEIFEATEVRFGNAYLWMRLTDGQNRHIPLSQVRWFSMSIESHADAGRNKIT